MVPCGLFPRRMHAPAAPLRLPAVSSPAESAGPRRARPPRNVNTNLTQVQSDIRVF